MRELYNAWLVVCVNDNIIVDKGMQRIRAEQELYCPYEPRFDKEEAKALARKRREKTLLIPCTIPAILHCKDCRYAHPMEGTESLNCVGRLTTGWDYYNDEPQENPVEPDGFCAWGERRSE